MNPLYLDSNATTPVDPDVLKEMLPYFSEKYGNASSATHSYGWIAQEAVDHARHQLAQLIESTPSELIFTSGATESNNLAIQGVALNFTPQQAHIITSNIEHKSVLDACNYLAEQGYALTVIPVDSQGLIDPNAIEAAITPQTKLISIMWANNEIGTIQPLAEIGKIAKKWGILFHSDATQGFNTHALNVNTMGLDLVSISGHKIYGPKGIGALYVRRRNPRVHLKPLFYGGGHEKGLRPGTLNVPGIVGLGAASDLVLKRRDSDARRYRMLRDRLWNEITSQCDGIRLNGHAEKRLPQNLNISIEGIRGEGLLSSLNGLAISPGSACHSESGSSSHVLSALETPDHLQKSSIRFGISRATTEEDIHIAATKIIETVRNLRKQNKENYL